MSKRVLIVEDERIVAEDIAQCLEESGYDVVGIANDSERALGLADEHRPDLILMDIVIQGERDGVDTAHIIKERFGGSVVYLTAYSQSKVIERAKETDPLGYVIKPFEEVALLSTVEIAINKQRLYQQLSAGREWFYATLRCVGDGVIATDNTGQIVFMNPVAEILTGWSMSEAEGTAVVDVYHSLDEQGQHAMNPALGALEKQEHVPLADNTVLVSRENAGRCIEDSGSLIRNADGVVLGAILTFRDITEKKAKAKQLIKYQRHLEELVDERTAALSARIDLESLISSSCVNLTKCDPERLEEAVCEVLQNLADFLKIKRFIVTQEESESILNQPIHNMEGEVGVYQQELESLYWSDLPWIEDQLQSHGHVLVQSSADLKETSPETLKVLQDIEMEGVLALPLGYDKDGRTWGMISFVSDEPLEFSVHDVRIMVVLSEIIHNLLKRRQSEKQRLELVESLNQSQKLEAIGKLSGGIAHDFNNMLVPIIGYSDTILQNSGLSADHRGELMEIRKAAESAASLTKQLLAFSRKQILQKDRINLNDTVVHLKNMLQRILGEDIVLKHELEKELWGVEADRGQLEQVIMNLCVNARHAMPEGGEIQLTTSNVSLEKGDPDRPLGNYVKVTVKDQGCGMSKELRDRIFDPFYTTKGHDGTGLGLSVVLGIIDQHGGWITVDSKLGKGSTFEVFLPSDKVVCAPERKGTSVVGSLEDRKGVDRVLLVEDEPSVLAFVQQALKKAGFIVTPAASFKAAIEAYDENDGRFDMVFTDAVLPDGTGMEILEIVLEKDPSLKPLLSSGYTDARALLDKAMDRKIPFLQKPYSLSQLYEKLREVIHDADVADTTSEAPECAPERQKQAH
ncbi:MAG: response regulator [Verrucomicrobiaceae bacterium]|nr:response regulator [Verrucomicrobiaceae bacterium]NCF91681.1 response regulator [Verrucomicrobiaceae bacterium]